MGSFAPRPVESTPVMPPHLSPLDHQEELSNNALPELHSVSTHHDLFEHLDLKSGLAISTREIEYIKF